MKAIYRSLSLTIVAAISMIAVMTPVSAQTGTGTVGISVRHCTQLTMPAELPGDPAEGCVPGPGLFSFYLVGDGTNEYELLEVGESGEGSIELPVGEYEVIEENTQVKMRVFVEEGQTTGFVFGFPRDEPVEPEPATGTVGVSVRYCTQLAAPAELPGYPEDGCVTGPGLFTFYLVGDGTNAYDQLAVGDNGEGAIDLPVGEYEVVEETTQVKMHVVVQDGQTTGFVFGFPRDEPVEPEPATGTVGVSVRYCTQLTAPVELPGYPDEGCVTGPGLFTFYLVGDGTNVFEQLAVGTDGEGVIELPVGEYEVIEENTQVKMRVVVEEGRTTGFVFGFPRDEQATTPTPVATAPPVKSLPKTGSEPVGSDWSSIGVALTGAVVLSGAAGLRLRNR